MIGGLTVAALSILGVGAMASPAPTAHATPTISGTTHPTVDEATDIDTVSLFIAPTDAVVRPGSAAISVDVTLRNSGEDTLPAGTLDLALGARIADAHSTAAPAFNDAAQVLVSQALRDTPAGSDQSLTVEIPRENWPLPATEQPGVFALQAAFTPEPGERFTASAAADEALPPVLTTATSPVVWRGIATGESVKLSTIVPLVLPDVVQSIPTPRQLSRAIPELEAAYAYALKQQATLAIDPRIIVAIRGYGLEAGENARTFLATLEASPLPSFLLQYADADPAAQAALGADALLAPTSFGFLTRLGSFETAVPADPDAPATGTTEPTGATKDSSKGIPADLAAAAPPSGETATDANSETPVDPTSLEALMAWPQGLPAAWPATGAVDSATLNLLRSADLSTTVLDSANVESATSPRVTLRASGSGVSDAFVSDADLTAGARLAVQGLTPAERALGNAQFQAKLTALADVKPTGVLFTVDRAIIAAGVSPWEQLTALTQDAWLTPTPLADQAAGNATLTRVTPNPADADPARLDALALAQEREPEVTAIRALYVHPEYVTGYQRARMLDLFATHLASPDVDFTEIADAYAERDSEIEHGVRIIDTRHTQLVGSSTRVPIQVQNMLPFNALVRLEVRPSSAVLAVEEETFSSVVVEAKSTQTILVPVKSRVSTGESSLVVTLQDVTGEVTAHTGEIEVSVTATIESIALITLGTLAVLLVGFGIYRSIRGRRERRGADPDSESRGTDDSADGPTEASAEDTAETAPDEPTDVNPASPTA
ncbi:DUF6049 family protein [Leucobacter sp. 1207-22]|uniref:DUF6049 family protein n=1 Tax=Leucobacter sp. 1207-22 TaxID=2604456 RepID=UPI004063B63A